MLRALPDTPPLAESNPICSGCMDSGIGDAQWTGSLSISKSPRIAIEDSFTVMSGSKRKKRTRRKSKRKTLTLKYHGVLRT
jgi:hypothetical protein